MGLFNDLGRRVEQFKQTVEATAEESTAYRCRACEAEFPSSHDECPECGADAVELMTAEE